MKKIILMFAMSLAYVTVQAQKNERDYLRIGNRFYRDSLFAKSEVNYRKAIERDARFPQAHFNLGNVLLAQGKPKEAMEAFEKASKLETNKFRLASIYNNMGVILQSQKKFDTAIECYKNSLRNNPNDDEVRYNLILCQHQLKKNPQQNKDDKQDKDGKGKDNKDSKDNKDQKKQEQKQKEQDKKENQQQQQQQQSQKDKMSKSNAEQILNAAMQDERNTQDKIKKAMRPTRKQLDKDW